MTYSCNILPYMRRRRIGPSEKNHTIEVRPSRHLRIQHLNPHPRDQQFENEMLMFKQYKNTGMPSSGFFTIPGRYHGSNNYHDDTLELQHSLPLSENNAAQASVYHSSYEQTGNKGTTATKDIVIFFIHGVGGSSDIWLAQMKYFSDQGYEIVAPDLIGHGFSCTVRDAKAYHFKEIAADVEELFDRYCKRKNVLIGHSYGASFATYLARKRPRRVIRLILISGGPPTPLMPQPGVFSLPYCLLACIKPCLLCRFYKSAFYSKQSPVVPKEVAFNIPAYVLQYTMNGQDWPDGDEVYHEWITCPSLLIYGAYDQLVSLQEEKDMAKVIHNSRLEVIEDAGHMVMIEAPAEVNRLIEEFISQPPTQMTAEYITT
ncbi:unnamed protein product [Candidula unifasciata]|uniref:acylglycerol lipase n=1 Tax=Candidula unifasciata TaxID=100452 RepID=A0A8S3ZLS3_9EUPU|nr:unnamed protein product [Candidula unifasciata]